MNGHIIKTIVQIVP